MITNLFFVKDYEYLVKVFDKILKVTYVGETKTCVEFKIQRKSVFYLKQEVDTFEILECLTTEGEAERIEKNNSFLEELKKINDILEL